MPNRVCLPAPVKEASVEGQASVASTWWINWFPGMRFMYAQCTSLEWDLYPKYSVYTAVWSSRTLSVVGELGVCSIYEGRAEGFQTVEHTGAS